VEDSKAIILLPICLVLAFLLIIYLKNPSRKFMESYVKENHIDVVVERAPCIPPLRLWLNARRLDSWCRLRYPDGTVKWVRLRPTLTSYKVEFFD